MKNILIIGATGQIGTELTRDLRKIYGTDHVVASTVKSDVPAEFMESGPFEFFDICDRQAIYNICKKYNIDGIINMAAILSAVGEEKPMLAWSVNMGGLVNVLETARELKINRILTPSSIAAFGPGTPLDMAPQETVLHPTTMYGITKVAGELLGDYYVQKYGMDCRGLRYPGIISNETLPGGGTTDYAVAIYYDAIAKGHYDCFVKEDTRLPMMYMPDCLKATIDLFHADFDKLTRHSDYNVGSMSFNVAEMADSIRKFIPDFTIEYNPDFRQGIADSWPNDLDDTAARKDWNWNPEYDLDKMTEDMLNSIRAKHVKGLI